MEKNKPVNQLLSIESDEKSLDDTSAHKLLMRPAKEEYIEEWTELIKTESRIEKKISEKSLVVFRLGKEWLALATSVFVEVIRNRVIHSIPHRSGKILLGCVNFRGQLSLTVGIHNLLEIGMDDESIKKAEETMTYLRMVVIEKEGHQWIFPVDEVLGILQCNLNLVRNVPVTVMKSTANYLKGVIYLEEKDLSIAFLDEELLFYSLKRSIL